MPERWQTRALHLAILAGFAVTQPVLDMLRRFPTFLVAHKLEPGEVIAVTAILAIGVPVLAGGLGALTTRLGIAPGLQIFRANFCLLLIATVLPPLHRLSIPDALALALAFAAAIAGTVAYSRFANLRGVFSWAAVALVVFPALFLTDSSMRSLIRDDGGATVSAVEIESTIPVVFLIFDEFPIASLLDGDHAVDRGRYPHFADLADGAHWFRNTSSVAAFTKQALPAILTGSSPEGDLLPIEEDYPNTLFGWMGSSYAMHVREAVTMLFPDALDTATAGAEGDTDAGRLGPFFRDLGVVYLHVLLPADFTSSLPSVRANWKGFGGAEQAQAPEPDAPGWREVREGDLEDLDASARVSRVETVLGFVSAIEAEPPGTLHLLHTLLPHSAWEHTPSGRNYCANCPPRPGLVEDIWSEDDRYVQLGYQRHLMQVALADRLLGTLVDQLRNLGIYDQALLVVTADHGASFWPGNPIRHLAGNAHPSDILDVPLFIKLPGQQEGVLSDRHARTIDIVPTILQQLGRERPKTVQGRSLLDPAYEPAAKKHGRDSEGEALEFDASPEPRDATVRRKLALFGAGDPDGIYAVGGHRRFLGRAIGEFRVQPDSRWYISTDRTYFEHASSARGFAPVFIEGAIDGEGAHEALSIVAVVNGTIRALSRCIPDSDTRVRFHLLVPESSYGSGEVELELLVLDESGQRTEFLMGHTRPIRFEQAPLPPGFPVD